MSNIKKAIAILAGISLYASAHAVPVFYSGTGNYYEYVSDSVLSTEAQAAAAAIIIINKTCNKSKSERQYYVNTVNYTNDNVNYKSKVRN